MVGEANLWRKAPRSAIWWVRLAVTHVLCILDTLNSVLRKKCTISSAYCYLHSSGAIRPAANSNALICCASSSTSEVFFAASVSLRSFFCARASSSTQPLRLLACSRGGGGGISVGANRAANIVSSTGSTEGASNSSTLASKIVSISVLRMSTAA